LLPFRYRTVLTKHDAIQPGLFLYPGRHTLAVGNRWELLSPPCFTSGEVLGTTKETGDRHRPLLCTHCKKFARGWRISADLRNTQELNGIRAEKPLRERGEIILLAKAGGGGLFDRMLARVARGSVSKTAERFA